MLSLQQLTQGTPYAAYTYSYPHKTAYRRLAPPRKLKAVWADQDKDALYLYLHVPFCEMRCGFCNLFTTANPREDFTEAYMAALLRHASRVNDAVGPARYARAAIGGGTPTYLSAFHLEKLFDISEKLFGIEGAAVPISVETSPRTAELEKLRILRDHRVERISIGIQSFVEAEVHASGRAQKNEWVESAIGRIRDLKFPVLNLDLIYGLPGQTVASWLVSLETALRWSPEELYLYPLYVRPLTGLGRWGEQAEDVLRIECYRAARDLLITHDYEQISMRMFRKSNKQRTVDGGKSWDGPVYCCQDDGMVGLGCGARSYTRTMHYSSEYAVESSGVRDIIGDYVSKSDRAFDEVDYGCELNDEERKRRWIIKTLLRRDGLNFSDFQKRFGTSVTEEFPELTILEQSGLSQTSQGRLRLTSMGLERSDAIGPWLYSQATHERMNAYEIR